MNSVLERAVTATVVASFLVVAFAVIAYVYVHGAGVTDPFLMLAAIACLVLLFSIGLAKLTSAVINLA